MRPGCRRAHSHRQHQPDLVIGHKDLAVTWLPTSAGDDQLLLVTRDALLLAD